MQVKTWALVGAGALVLVLALLPSARSRRSTARPDAPAAPSSNTQRSAARRSARPVDSSAATADPPDAAPVKTTLPDLTRVTGSCLQERANEQLCSDYFAGPDEIDAVRLKCRKGVRYVSATWSDAPCDHASSHGGCWASHARPARIRWFYGELHKDFHPGADTHRVCGGYSVAFLPDGTPVKHDGSPEPGAPASDDPADEP